MVNYTCELCDYDSRNKNNYERHKLSNNHKQNVIKMETEQNAAAEHSQRSLNKKQYYCESCGNVFDRINNLTKHYQVCCKRNNQINELMNEIQLLKNKVENHKLIAENHKLVAENHKLVAENSLKEILNYKDELNFHKKLILESSKLIKTTIQSLADTINQKQTAHLDSLDFNDVV